jgi:hypothetical protein
MQGRTICVVECDDSHIGYQFLSAQNSAMMCAIDSGGAYCMYPELRMRGQNLNLTDNDIGWWEDTYTEFTVGLDTHTSTENWTRQCGSACPSIWRRTNGDGYSTLQFTWDAEKGQTMRTVMDKDISWQLPGEVTTRCLNQLCANFWRIRCL